MTATLFFDPAYDRAVAANEAVTLRGVVETDAASRSLGIKVDAVTRLTWDGVTVTLSSGWSGAVSRDGADLVATLRPTSGWTSGTAYSFEATYQDSLTSPAATSATRVAQVDFTLDFRTPAPGDTGIGRRPLVHIAATPDEGAAAGADLTVGGLLAIAEGVPEVPEFEARAWAHGGASYAQAAWRRYFDHGARVEVTAKPGTVIDGRTYRKEFRWTFAIVGKTRRADALPEIPVSGHPTFDYLRECAAACLRPDSGSPNIATGCAYLARRSVVGQLVRFAPTFDYTHAPEDVPTEDHLASLVSRARPVWRAALEELAPPEWRASLAAAWDSGHVVEQAAAVVVILLGRRIHGL